MQELGHSEFMFQDVKYYAESSWFVDNIDNGIMTKHVYKYKRGHEFIGLLQWNVGNVDKKQANNTWEIDDNVLFIIFETSIFYWYHCPTELLICVAFQNELYTKTEINKLKEFQSFVNCVDKSYLDKETIFNDATNILIKDRNHYLINQKKKMICHKLEHFPYEGVTHIYNSNERIPILDCMPLLK